MGQRAGMQKHRTRGEVAGEPSEAGEHHEQGDPAGGSALQGNDPAADDQDTDQGIDKGKGKLAGLNRAPLGGHCDHQAGRKQDVLQPMPAR